MNVYFGSKSNPIKNNDEDTEEDTGEIYRENNHIYFYSEIDRKSISTLLKLLREAQEYCALTAFKIPLPLSKIPIYLHISSLGGYISDALIAVDMIQRSIIPVYSIAEGSIASAATLLSIVCKKRFICPNAFIMIHQLSSEVGGKMNEITDEFANLSESMNILKQFYLQHTHFSKKQLTKLLTHDIFLNAETSIKYGLVDKYFT
jgi:ATP-dependent Clp protease protease subunit